MLKDLMYPIIGAIYEVHKELAPGLNEYVYQEGLAMQLEEEGILYERFPDRQMYSGKGCAWVSEYGGLQWSKGDRGDAWGYGNAPKTEEEFLERFKGLAEALLFNPFITGLCYTQLTDVEQETNGLYTYDRKQKFDPAFFHAVLTQKAAIEE